MTPIESFRGWYEAQDEEIREEIADKVGGSLPQNGDDAAYEEFLKNSQAKFREFLDALPPRREHQVGIVLMIREVISVLAFKYGSSPEDFEQWNEKIDQGQQIAEKMGDADAVERFTKYRFDNERIRTWVKAAESWKQLRASVLSNDALDAWLEDGMPGQGLWDNAQ
ncbi:MAG: hypothetical protein INR62_12560 [Rhodospirillales bacterium]|nr:hypothetical protein [Acetobacter sp.]